MNVFFKKTIFTSYENYFYDKSYTNYYLEYSNKEIYSLEKGFNRYINKPKDYEVFSKIYLRSSMVSDLNSKKIYETFRIYCTNNFFFINSFYCFIFNNWKN